MWVFPLKQYCSIVHYSSSVGKMNVLRSATNERNYQCVYNSVE